MEHFQTNCLDWTHFITTLLWGATLCLNEREREKEREREECCHVVWSTEQNVWSSAAASERGGSGEREERRERKWQEATSLYTDSGSKTERIRKSVSRTYYNHIVVLEVEKPAEKVWSVTSEKKKCELKGNFPWKS